MDSHCSNMHSKSVFYSRSYRLAHKHLDGFPTAARTCKVAKKCAKTKKARRFWSEMDSDHIAAITDVFLTTWASAHDYVCTWSEGTSNGICEPKGDIKEMRENMNEHIEELAHFVGEKAKRLSAELEHSKKLERKDEILKRLTNKIDNLTTDLKTEKRLNETLKKSSAENSIKVDHLQTALKEQKKRWTESLEAKEKKNKEEHQIKDFKRNELINKHILEVKKIKKKHGEEVDTLTKEVSDLKERHDEDVKKINKKHAVEIDTLTNEISDLSNRHDEDTKTMNIVKVKHDEETKVLKNLNVEKDKDAKQQLENLKKTYDDEIKKIRQDNEVEVALARTTCATQLNEEFGKKEVLLQQAHKNQILQMTEDYNTDLQSAEALYDNVSKVMHTYKVLIDRMSSRRMAGEDAFDPSKGRASGSLPNNGQDKLNSTETLLEDFTEDQLNFNNSLVDYD